jgi:hypothetical protein
MVETNDSVCNRINVLDMSPFADITGTASKGPVVRRIRAITDERDDVLDLEREVEHGFRRVAVLAAVSRP